MTSVKAFTEGDLTTGNDRATAVGLPRFMEATVLAGATVLGGFMGTTSPAIRQDTFITVGETAQAAIRPARTVRRVVEPAERLGADDVAWVKEHSGLTWEQLGRTFGVSRRAVHMWANGGRLNRTNEMRLHEFVAVIRDLESRGAATPDAVRSRLLEIDSSGTSVLGRMQAVRHNGPTWGTPHGPEHYVDAVQTPLGQPASGTES